MIVEFGLKSTIQPTGSLAFATVMPRSYNGGVLLMTLNLGSHACVLQGCSQAVTD